jgi:hypothetical protein
MHMVPKAPDSWTAMHPNAIHFVLFGVGARMESVVAFRQYEQLLCGCSRASLGMSTPRVKEQLRHTSFFSRQVSVWT